MKSQEELTTELLTKVIYAMDEAMPDELVKFGVAMGLVANYAYRTQMSTYRLQLQLEALLESYFKMEQKKKEEKNG